MNKNQLKKQLLQKELQIKKMQLHQSTNDVCEQLYNSLIIEKAVIKKDLEELDKNHFIENVKNFFSPKKKLICDYWRK